MLPGSTGGHLEQGQARTGTAPARANNRAMTADCMRPDEWLSAQGWRPFDFQREVWAAMTQGRSGLLHATTGSGKTYAVWLGAIARSSQLDRARPHPEWAGRGGGAQRAAD
jgi:ATP-dependent Lhr-like helicase